MRLPKGFEILVFVSTVLLLAYTYLTLNLHDFFVNPSSTRSALFSQTNKSAVLFVLDDDNATPSSNESPFSTMSTIASNPKRSFTRLPSTPRPAHLFQTNKSLANYNLTCNVVPDINCAGIFAGDLTALRAKNWAVTIPKGYDINATTFLELSQTPGYCEPWKTQQGFITKPLTNEEAEFPIAYSIQVYKDPAQLVRLLRAIYRPQNYYCIHWDKSSDPASHTAVRAVAKCFENVFLPRDLTDVEYAAFSQLEAELVCIRELLAFRAWRYFINLTGQEFPLQTSLTLVKILKVFNGGNSVELTVKHGNWDRYEGAGPVPVNVNVTKGAVHIIATRPFVDYAVNNATALKFLEWLKKTRNPDESYFSSLNNSPHLGVPGAYLGGADSPGNPFLVRFKNWGQVPCAGKFAHAICVFGVGDVRQLATRKELFANKFYSDFEPAGYACMEELLCNRTRDELAGIRVVNASYYAQFDFTSNHVTEQR